MSLITCLALLVVPLASGALFGTVLVHLRRQGFGGLVAAIVFVSVPVATAVALVVRFPLIGLWDAALEGLLFGVGLCWAAHRLFADDRNVFLAGASSILAALLIELCVRLFLPPPPAFPMQDGPHLLLANALQAPMTNQPWDTLSKDLVCSIVYGERYPPIFDLTRARHEIVTPQTFVPRPQAQSRVLHLGDSMVFGFGLPRDAVFTTELERLEPKVQHINAAIPGTAPDAYLAVLQSWVASRPIDVVVMHIYEGNDLDGLDSRYPCCDWQSLLAYDADGATLRCPQGTAPALGHAGYTWLRHHTPAPYIVRALIGTSSAAAYIAAALSLEPYFLADQPPSTRLKHLEAILRAARDALAARGIAFAVHVLPSRLWLEDETSWQHFSPDIIAAATRAGVRVLDSSDFFRSATDDGESLFFDNRDIHFDSNGHHLLAAWLHERLRAEKLSEP